MPLLAYFWKVGAALLALLLIADFCLPKASVADRKSVDRPTIRIQSDRKWPERVVLDTSLPAIVAAGPEIARTETATPVAPAEPPVMPAQAANALAMARSEQPSHEAVDSKRPRKTIHTAMRSKRHAPQQMLLAARQPQFAWFGYRYW
jgi:hypothetical protein